MIEFVPRQHVAARLNEGFRLVPNVTYVPGDWAVLMEQRADPEPLTFEQTQALLSRLEPPPPTPKDKNRCKFGHYLPDTAYVRPDGYTACRECKRRMQAEYNKRRSMKRQRAAEFA